ncbi:hypothetical protein CVIRNUC_003744 [Coccomyxa viridis]|uniref:J domain-containing protein n=1 Tax=Coccomyxa viridis TaxID=1274662 RepID=A0AAV1HZG6_9CHLO|nr:hypothetical protein CVIRNUC_003744 [Coccomyxa viridis]
MGVSLYDVLGISETATQDEVKLAYRRKALEHHPDRNPGGKNDAFREISDAYEVLRDAGRRSSYDALRSGYGGFEGSQSSSSHGAHWKPGEDNFDDFLNKWWQRQGFKREFEEKMDEQMRKERAEATLRARAAAWEAEKAEAQANRERFERQRWRTKNARAARHARILQKFWHTNSGLVWQDGLVAAMLLASLGLGAFQLRGASTATNSKPDPEDCL